LWKWHHGGTRRHHGGTMAAPGSTMAAPWQHHGDTMWHGHWAPWQHYENTTAALRIPDPCSTTDAPM